MMWYSNTEFVNKRRFYFIWKKERPFPRAWAFCSSRRDAPSAWATYGGSPISRESTAELIIFPACSAFGVSTGEGPALVFVTLPNIFNHMALGRLWGGAFFLFLSFAALSTVIAVFENIISFTMDRWGLSRQKAVMVNFVGILLLSMPCVLGFNVWSGLTVLGMDVSGLEDFLVSQNFLPLGSLLYVLFCTSRKGWGWDKFLAEANEGEGLRFPKGVRFYVSYILPLIVLFIFVMGYWNQFGEWIKRIF